MKPPEIGEARRVAANKRTRFIWHREGNPVEQALAIRDLQRGGLDVRACAKEVGTSPGQVVKRLRLLRLHPTLLDQVRTGRIGPAKAYTLSRLPPKDQLRLARGKKAPTGNQIENAVRRQMLSREVMMAVTAPGPTLKPCPRCRGQGQVPAKPTDGPEA